MNISVSSTIDQSGGTGGSQVDSDGFKTQQVDVGDGITLHVAELGEGPAVLFCHGFPDTGYTWRGQMKAVAAAGYRAIAPDMRGYGRSSAPADEHLYTPFHTAGDLVGLLDALGLETAILVGHDWGATHSWNAAMMRPDRFTAIFCLSVPYLPRGGVSIFDRMRASGREKDYYAFEMARPEADMIWANAAATIPAVLYWASGSAPIETRWSPLDPNRNLVRPLRVPLPAWASEEYVDHAIAEFSRTGFHGGLNYYRAAELYHKTSGAFKGAKVTQPAFFMWGGCDGMRELFHFDFEGLRKDVPNLQGLIDLPEIGHWMQHEAAGIVNEQLVKFLDGLRHGSTANQAR